LHGQTFPIGLDAGKRYIWVDGGTASTFAFVVTVPVATLTSASLNLSLIKWNPDSAPTVTEIQVPFTTPAFSYNFQAVITTPGYYCVSYTGLIFTGATSGGSGLLTISSNWYTYNTTSAAAWSTLHLGDLDPNNGGDVTMGRKIRVNSSSLLLTNTTASIQKQGTVLASRLNELPFYSVTPAVLSKAAEKYTGGAETGVYTYKEFTQYAETYRQCIDLGYLVFDLAYTDYYHFIQVSATSYVSSPNTFTLSLSSNVEFQSDIARHVKGCAPPKEDQDLIFARSIVSSSPEWFFENPSHLARVMGFIARGARGLYNGARTYGPNFMQGIASMGGSYAPLFSAAGTLLRSLP
jgi:hypothetical protein